MRDDTGAPQELRDSNQPGHCHRPSEAGMALVVSMMVLALLTTLCIAGISSSSLEMNIAANDREAKQAFYLCEAGLEDAKYKIISGWGVGTGSGTAPGYGFAFDAASMPDTVKTGGNIGWSADRWANFTLADEHGLEYRILANTAGYALTTQAPVPASAPANGYARIFYRNNGPLVLGQGNGSPAPDTVVIDPAPGAWAAGMWDGYWLRDSSGNQYRITASAITAPSYTLTLDAGGLTPAAGTYDILLAVNGIDGADTITVFSNPLDTAGNPGGPNSEWQSNALAFDVYWFLRDAAGTLFEITGTQYLSGPARMVLTVGGAPDNSNDEVQLVTNPYLVDTGTVTVDFGSSAGLQVSYGTVDVNVMPTGIGAYRVSAVSTSTATGNTKQLRLNAALTDGSQTQVGNWRLVQ